MGPFGLQTSLTTDPRHAEVSTHKQPDLCHVDVSTQTRSCCGGHTDQGHLEVSIQTQVMLK